MDMFGICNNYDIISTVLMNNTRIHIALEKEQLITEPNLKSIFQQN